MAPILFLLYSLQQGGYQHALELYSHDRFAEAHDVLRAAARTSPRSFPVRFLAGATLVRLNRVNESIEELRVAHRLNPSHADAAKLLAAQCLAAGRPAEALAALQRLLKAAAPDEETYLLAVQSHQHMGDLDAIATALPIAERALKQFPASAGLMAWKGFALAELGRPAEARPLLETALRLDAGSAAARATLADVLRQEGDYPAAIEAFRQVLNETPGDITARIGLGRALAASGEHEAALDQLRAAVTQAPGDARARLALSRLYAQLGDRENAAREAAEFRRLRRN
jgi:tetratricopeptide (TPR) repeat protein